jgi:hypothetical protein
LSHDKPDIQAKASSAITSFTGTNDAIRNALCDAGAVGALAGVVSKVSGEARKQACGALWGLVLGGGGGQGGVDAVEGLLGSDGEEGVKAGLEGLSDGVAGSEVKQRAFVERFGVVRIVGLLGHGSAGVQAKACDVVRALTTNCALNRVAFGERGIVEGVVRLLGSDDAEVQKEAVMAVWTTVLSNVKNKDCYLNAGAAAAICKLLQSPVAIVQEKAAGCVYSVCAQQHVRSQDAFRDAGCVPLLVGLLSSSSADVQNWSSQAILRLSEGHSVNTCALCDAGAVGALAGVVSKGSGEARKQACGALWGLVLGGGGGQGGVDAVEGLLGSDGEEGVKAGLEGLSDGVAGSEVKQRAFVERFGVVRIVGLLGHGSAGVQAKARDVVRALTTNCALNRVAFGERGIVEGVVRMLHGKHLPRSLHIRGATGNNSAVVNGTWDPTDERSRGKPVYVKRGDCGKCIHFYSRTSCSGSWVVTATECKGENDDGWAWLHQHFGPLEAASSKSNWMVTDGTHQVEQPDVRVETDSIVTVTVEGIQIETEHGRKSFHFETCEDANFSRMVRCCKEEGQWMTCVDMWEGGGGLNVRVLFNF